MTPDPRRYRQQSLRPRIQASVGVSDGDLVASGRKDGDAYGRARGTQAGGISRESGEPLTTVRLVDAQSRLDHGAEVNLCKHHRRRPGVMHPCRVTDDRIERTVRSAQHVQTEDRASARVSAVMSRPGNSDAGGIHRGPAPAGSRRKQSGGYLLSTRGAAPYAAERNVLSNYRLNQRGSAQAPAPSDGRISGEDVRPSDESLPASLAGNAAPGPQYASRAKNCGAGARTPRPGRERDHFPQAVPHTEGSNQGLAGRFPAQVMPASAPRHLDASGDRARSVAPRPVRDRHAGTSSRGRQLDGDRRSGRITLRVAGCPTSLPAPIGHMQRERFGRTQNLSTERAYPTVTASTAGATVPDAGSISSRRAR